MSNYSCCYVLTDNENLKFFNQMMVSLSSLRHTGFAGKVYILTDRDTEKLLSARLGELEKLTAEIIAVDIEGNYSQLEKSRYIKTSMRRYITGDALYIDTDTLIAALLPEHISDEDLAMAYDGNGLDDENTYNWHKALFEICGYGLPDHSRAFNGGIIWMRDTDSVHRAFELWHAAWKETQARGVPYDQASLLYLRQKKAITIHELDDTLNVQIGKNYFSFSIWANAYVFHLNNNKMKYPIFPLHDPAIQALDYRDERIQDIIRDPLSTFAICRWIKKDCAIDRYMNTDAFYVGSYLFRKHKRVFAMLERASHLYRKRKKKKRGSAKK